MKQNTTQKREEAISLFHKSEMMKEERLKKIMRNWGKACQKLRERKGWFQYYFNTSDKEKARVAINITDGIEK